MTPETMQWGSQKADIWLIIIIEEEKIPPTHRQGHYNNIRDRQGYLSPKRQQFWPTYIAELAHQDQTNTGNQPCMPHNLVCNTRQYGQAPTQNQFQNPIVPQQQSQMHKLHGRVMHQNLWLTYKCNNLLYKINRYPYTQIQL